MEIQIKKLRAHEFSKFLACSPLEVPNPKSYLKLQRLRIAVDKANSEFKGYMDKYMEDLEKEMKPFREALQQFRNDPEEFKAKADEFDGQIAEIMKERSEEAEKHAEKHGLELISVPVNEEELAQARLHFEKLTKVGEREVPNGAIMWGKPEAYVEMAELLGIN
jgi:predicted ribosome quality control (RQC) complex YloA/Tae2 family protein